MNSYTCAYTCAYVCAVITGLPGTGKTTLAIALAHHFNQQGLPCFVLHTDILKVTLRQFAPEIMAGITKDDNFQEKIKFLHPFLQEQCRKAEKDGYFLIIEGTLAIAFQPESALYVVLEVPEVERQQRIQQKPICARQSLAKVELNRYRQALLRSIQPQTLRLLSDQPLLENVKAIHNRVMLLCPHLCVD